MYLREPLENDKEIILSFIKENRFALRYASETCKNDQKIVKFAIHRNSLSYDYASVALKKKRPVFMKAHHKLKNVFFHKILKTDRQIIVIRRKKEDIL